MPISWTRTSGTLNPFSGTDEKDSWRDNRPQAMQPDPDPRSRIGPNAFQGQRLTGDKLSTVRAHEVSNRSHVHVHVPRPPTSPPGWVGNAVGNRHYLPVRHRLGGVTTHNYRDVRHDPTRTLPAPDRLLCLRCCRLRRPTSNRRRRGGRGGRGVSVSNEAGRRRRCFLLNSVSPTRLSSFTAGQDRALSQSGRGESSS